MNNKDFEKLVFGMAHQVRNPCAIILSNAELLLQDPNRAPEMQHSLGAIVNGVKYLQARLEEFVEFSKPLFLNLKKIYIHQILKDLMAIVKEKYRLQKTKISCNDINKDLVLERADHQQILLALLSVIINAIESIKEEGSVTINAEKSGKNVAIIIKDTGCGIRSNDLPEIFSPFYSTKQSGIGIGLTIAKRIIDAHGGEIKVQSQQGSGTVVTIQIPN